MTSDTAKDGTLVAASPKVRSVECTPRYTSTPNFDGTRQVRGATARTQII